MQCEQPFHFPAYLDGVAGLVDDNIGPSQRLARGNRLEQLHTVGEPERQAADPEGSLSLHELADYRVAALAVQDLAGFQITLGGGHRVCAKPGGAAGWLAPQSHRRDRDADLQADQMPAL